MRENSFIQSETPYSENPYMVLPEMNFYLYMNKGLRHQTLDF